MKKKDPDDWRAAPLWHELGMVRDKMGCYSTAFEAISRYGELMLANPRAAAIDTDTRSEQIDQKLQWILGDGLSRTQPGSNPGIKSPVFLVGFPRSGTTMTEQVLGAHPRIVTSEEQGFLGPAFQRLVAATGANFPAPEVLELADANALLQAGEAYWQKVSDALGDEIDIFVDKLPLNIIELGFINALFPSARIIVALRDPRDVCLSCFFQHFDLNPSMKNFLRWDTTTAFYARVMGFYQAIKNKLTLSILEVRYEDTVEDLPGQARKILDHIGVEWNDSVLEFYRQTRDRFVNTPSYQAVREPVHTRARGRWKNYPQAMQQALPDLQRFIDEFGYAAGN